MAEGKDYKSRLKEKGLDLIQIAIPDYQIQAIRELAALLRASHKSGAHSQERMDEALKTIKRNQE